MTRNTTIAYIFFSILFIGMTFLPEPRAFWMFKFFPIILLLIEVSKDSGFNLRRTLMLALGASATGDLLLHFDMFVPGLSAFLVAQILYAFIFFKHRKSASHRIGLSVVMFLYLIGTLILLYPNLGDLMIPVIAYLFVIAIMGLLSVQSSFQLKWAVLGAIFFIISDSLIAVNKFIIDLPVERVLVMSTYYAAQWMLVVGFLENKIISDE
jgi:uncharacterized membrane protein YhhN